MRSPTIVLIPVSRDELIPGLIEGRGDVVMGNLTITPERQKLVDFGPPLYPNVDELVISGPAAKNIGSFDDLVKTGLYVRRSSSYFEHLQGLNAERKKQGQKPIPITEADENLEDYDLLDMVNAGVINAVVVDRLISEITNVPESAQTMPMPNRKPASEAPIIAKLLVAAKFEFFPPVLMSRYSEAVTTSQKISRNSR